MAGAKARVRFALSSDHGRTFGAPVLLDDNAPLGRGGVSYSSDGRLWIVWLARREKAATVEVGVVDGGVVRARVSVASVPATRRSGYPRIVGSKRGALVAWTADGRVRFATVQCDVARDRQR